MNGGSIRESRGEKKRRPEEKYGMLLEQWTIGNENVYQDASFRNDVSLYDFSYDLSQGEKNAHISQFFVILEITLAFQIDRIISRKNFISRIRSACLIPRSNVRGVAIRLRDRL